MNVNEVIQGLAELGCDAGTFLGARTVSFARTDRGFSTGASVGLRLRRGDVPRFARLIRQAALLERTGGLVADIDRMGEVIGWHAPTTPVSPGPRTT